ncbi:hypothetical protein P3X46_001239 [Hevea brasiliensis]|uniref:Protein kinase domain-containing protein n=1 Tax=Hevea brasiliensis TaxID=3981 RepID=A0ABQ9NEA9_HEVBR|nr:putative receptor-like protein kinase At3g47110 [Hevea brasiliensis]KAJ9190002.1 hypothetical protein P3X46_001239 [Hevea brasiliensis]
MYQMKSYSLSLGFLLCFINLQWMQADAASGNETDQLALLKFKETITGDPNQIFKSWNDSLHFCNWFGITCSSKHQRATSLVLKGQNLFGSISPYIGNLSFLRFINLQNNSLCGEVPQEVGRLFRLQYFLLNNNSLEGKIPTNLTGCSQLRVISLQGNNLSGKIPEELGRLIKLQELWLDKNNLKGEIPASLGNLSSLTIFYVTFNSLVGHIPDDMGRLASLTTLAVGVNQLSGIIPPSIFNISSLVKFQVTRNQLNGSLPDKIGLTLPNLNFFGFGENDFSGSIPNSLFNASQLEIIDLGWNNFVGQVPMNIGNLKNLWRIRLHGNNLGSNSTNDLAFFTSLENCTKLKILDFGRNNFGGVLPNSVSNLSTELNLFYFGRNQIRGTIPAGLENLINLVGFVMHYNIFTGVIPYYFGRFQKLQVLDLTGNRLSGQLPSSLANLTQLSILFISKNNFEGTIPSNFGNLKRLNCFVISQNKLSGGIPHELLGLSSLSQALDLSHNSLSGNLPPEIGKLTSLTTLVISGNNLSGEIPTTIGKCLSLEYAYLQDNSFQGTIPSSLASLKGLQHLDLSRNNLTRKIPEGLKSIQFLVYLNLSFNDLEGEVPTEGVFRNASALSLTGNSKLCGGVPELNLPKCPGKMTEKGKSLAFKLAIILPSAAFCALLLLAFLVYCKMRSEKKSAIHNLQRSSSESLMMNRILLKVSYRELSQATNGFSSNNLIGSGNFGSVYKGFLDQVKRSVAIKVLKLETKGASKSFIAESQVLMNVRHRNLVKLLAYCSSMDGKLDEFKALVFEFLGNGSLEMWLHPDIDRTKNLSLLQRLNVAIDVASALHYLHDLCERPIIHCDLKPSNVILDDDMAAHVCDFGLARLLSTSHPSSQNQFSTTGIKGTIGYAAPEYGMGCEASRMGDVYSYGILVLEMFSGRRPIDEMFKECFNLHGFVKAALPQRVMQIVDPNLLTEETKEDDQNLIEEDEEIISCEILSKKRANVRNCLLSILEIGVTCSKESPKERMSMRDVTNQLHMIKNAFLEGSGPSTTSQDPSLCITVD